MNQTETAEHTPTPWASFTGAICTASPPNDVVCVCERNPLASREINEAIADANARFIVLAANSHDELVAACRGLLAEVERLGLWPIGPNGKPIPTSQTPAETTQGSIPCDAARAALANAQKSPTPDTK